MTYYQLLGVPQTATLDQLHSAYRSAVRRFHPDVNKAPNAAQVTAKLNEAWHILSDPHGRSAYDRSIARPQPRPATPTARRPPPSYGTSADARGPASAQTGNAGYGQPGYGGYGQPGYGGYGQPGNGWYGQPGYGTQYTQYQRPPYGPTVAPPLFQFPSVLSGTFKIVIAVAFIASVVHWLPLIMMVGAGLFVARMFGRSFR